MGYTHYHPQLRDFGDQEWKAICAAARRIIKESDVPLDNGCCGKWHRPKPTVSPKQILLGGAETSCETFQLSKKIELLSWEEPGEEGYFRFTKTAREPYDAVVVAILRAANEIAPGALELSSDGDEREPDPNNPGRYRDVPGGEVFPVPPEQKKFRVTLRRTVEVKVEVDAKDAAHAQDIAAARVVGMKETPKGAKVSIHSGPEDVEVWM